MTIMSFMQAGRCDAKIEALRAELGGILSARVLEAEALDFLWEARVRERYLGHEIRFDVDDHEVYEECFRVAFISVLDGCFYAGSCLVDGGGDAIQLLWKRSFDGLEEAESELLRAR